MGIDKLFPIFVAAVCVVLLVRLGLGEQRRMRMDRAFAGYWFVMRRHVLAVWEWRSRRRSAARARRVAEDVINRVRHRVDKEGNVLTPEAFKGGPRKPD